ncbi:MAG: 6-phosphogluconolactonase [Bacteroidota bacterium]
MNKRIYSTKQDVALEFANFFAELVKDKDVFHVALSGGSTPKIVFEMLAIKFKDTIDWSKIHFYWGDERCVPPTDEQSNYKMTVDYLFLKIEVPKDNIHRILGESNPQREAFRYANLLEIYLDRVAGIPQFDLVILGMGSDGHTASIFPYEIALWEAKEHCRVATHPETDQKRITITGGLINHAKEVAFLVTGADKAEKVAEIINREGDYGTYPAALVSPMSGNLHWFLDADAAQGISQEQV